MGFAKLLNSPSAGQPRKIAFSLCEKCYIKDGEIYFVLYARVPKENYSTAYDTDLYPQRVFSALTKYKRRC